MFCAVDMSLLNDIYNERLNSLKPFKYRYTFDKPNPHMLAKTARRWILDKAISMCMDNLQKDPIDIIDDMIIEYEVILLQVDTNEANIVFDNAVKELKEIKSELEYRINRRRK